ncbi:MAG: Gfo/Idh/MocA family oxidoreductase [Actinomycetota bacterium]
MTSSTIRLGLVGCGRLAELGYAQAAAESARVELVAVADPSTARTAAVRRAVIEATPGGVEPAMFGDHEEMVDASELDAVVVATPVDTHVPLVEALVSTDTPVLVEKPPARNGDGARRLAAVGGAVWVGFNRRFVPALAAMRHRVAGVDGYRSELLISYRRASWSPITVADDALLDVGPHLIDLARWLHADDVVDLVDAEVQPARARCQLRLGRGRALIEVVTDGVYRERVAVADGVGQSIASYQVGGAAAAVTGRLAGRSGGDVLAGSLRGQLDAFAAAVVDAQRASYGLGTAADGIAVMDVVDAVRARSSNERTPT